MVKIRNFIFFHFGKFGHEKSYENFEGLILILLKKEKVVQLLEEINFSPTFLILHNH